MGSAERYSSYSSMHSDIFEKPSGFLLRGVCWLDYWWGNLRRVEIVRLREARKDLKMSGEVVLLSDSEW